MNHRIIARLDIKGPNLVKGIHLEGLRVMGKPEDFASYYYENGADELLYMDVVASLYDRNSLKDIITRTANEIFIPLTVGGGLRTIEDITEVLRYGADKVSLNTAAIKNPEIIRQASEAFGSSTIVIAIEAIKQNDGKYLCYTDNAREYTGVDAFEWAQRAEELGAGELIVTSVDKEGTGEGFDIELTRKISDSVKIPVIAHGGPGKLEHFKEVIEDGHADAVCAASMLHYNYAAKNKSVNEFSAEGNVTFINSGKTFGKIDKAEIQDIKKYLNENGIDCRYTQ
ncbi:MAG: imidazole glycerol phosphate synthase subunit HisF [Ignavibacteria bacterium]|nr:imidazole glycerol phosphate synthase subunit HisF [Ignavibacteria bacterium]